MLGRVELAVPSVPVCVDGVQSVLEITSGGAPTPRTHPLEVGQCCTAGLPPVPLIASI